MVYVEFWDKESEYKGEKHNDGMLVADESEADNEYVNLVNRYFNSPDIELPMALLYHVGDDDEKEEKPFARIIGDDFDYLDENGDKTEV